MTTSQEGASDDDRMNLEETIAVLHRIVQALTLAESTLTATLPGSIWLVSSLIGNVPSVTRFDTIAELGASLANLRTLQEQAEVGQVYFAHIFFGQRWYIRRGRTWKIVTGVEEYAIDGTVDAAVDQSGLLATPRVDLDAVVPSAPGAVACTGVPAVTTIPVVPAPADASDLNQLWDDMASEDDNDGAA